MIPPSRGAKVAKGLMYSFAAIFFGIIGGYAWLLFPYDYSSICLFILSTLMAITSVYVFILGIETLAQSS
jgi:hypothetical protein